jgi:hypothetical protein
MTLESRPRHRAALLFAAVMGERACGGAGAASPPLSFCGRLANSVTKRDSENGVDDRQPTPTQQPLVRYPAICSRPLSPARQRGRLGCQRETVVAHLSFVSVPGRSFLSARTSTRLPRSCCCALWGAGEQLAFEIA